MKLCWSKTNGPIEHNAEHGVWMLVERATGKEIDIPRMFYVDDEAGEVWAYGLNREGKIFAVADQVAITRYSFGPGTIALRRRP